MGKCDLTDQFIHIHCFGRQSSRPLYFPHEMVWPTRCRQSDAKNQVMDCFCRFNNQGLVADIVGTII